MKKTVLLLLAASFISLCTFAQSDAKAIISETTYMLPKRGYEKAYVDAVKTHNAKYHAEGTGNQARLREVLYGEMAGWYVWVHGTCSYADLDTDLGQAHDDDWSKTVDIHVEEYGAIDIWEYDPDISWGLEKIQASKYHSIWKLDIKRGEGYRFVEMMKKLSAAVESEGKHANAVFWNVVSKGPTQDAAIVWTFNKFAEWDDSTLKAVFEKEHGEDSWRKFNEEWEEVVVSYEEEIREVIK